jgi:hypothetical protein
LRNTPLPVVSVTVVTPSVWPATCGAGVQGNHRPNGVADLYGPVIRRERDDKALDVGGFDM